MLKKSKFFLSLTLILSFMLISVNVYAKSIVEEKDLLKTPRIPLQTNVYKSGSLQFIFEARSQILKEGEIYDPWAIMPYTNERTQGKLSDDEIERIVADYESKALNFFEAAGYNKANLVKVVSIDFNETYEEQVALFIMEIILKNGESVFTPVLLNQEQVTAGYIFDWQSSLGEFIDFYNKLFVDVLSFAPRFDLNASAWAVPDVDEFIKTNGIISNYDKQTTDRIFNQYSDGITRQDFIYLVMNILDKHYQEVINDLIQTDKIDYNLFEDTDKPYLIYAHSLGIISGKTPSTFEPNALLSRAEAAAILKNVLVFIEEQANGDFSDYYIDKAEFSDVPPDVWSYEAIAMVSSLKDPVTNNIVMGLSAGGEFLPNDVYSKEQSIVTLMRVERILQHMRENSVNLIKARSNYILKGEILSASNFIEGSGYKNAKILNPVNYDQIGKQTVIIQYTDGSNHEKILEADLFILDGKKELVLEVGHRGMPLSVVDFIPAAYGNRYKMVTTVGAGDLNTIINNRKLILNLEGNNIIVSLSVIDTTPPTAQAVNVKAPVGQPVYPEQFVENIVDACEVRIYFALEPDYDLTEQDIKIRLADTYGNISEIISHLSIVSDTEPPVINGAVNIFALINSSPDYLVGVTASDNQDEHVEILVDSSNVDISELGSYEIIYKAVDSSGNSSEERAIITITNIDPNAVYKMADNILASITNESMTKYQKTEAIYNWSSKNIRYINSMEKQDVISGAYEAFSKHRGDCYAYYAASEILLTRAGIDNMMIKRIEGTRTRHYWNLVNIGDGWYHFDATPYRGSGTGFMFTDEEARRKTVERGEHYQYYRYNADLYPEIVQ